MRPLERRVRAAQKTLDTYRKRKFRWGRDDCWTMVKYHLREMNKPASQKVQRYRTAAQARAELKRLGKASVGALLDGQFERIPPAAAIVGDIMELQGKGLTGLVIAMGNGRVCGFHEDIECADVLQPEYDAVITAWRVVPIPAKRN